MRLTMGADSKPNRPTKENQYDDKRRNDEGPES